MPLTISHELMRDFALVAPRQTRWSYSVPGVDDGGARSFTDAKHAIEAAYQRTWVTHAFIYARVPGFTLSRAILPFVAFFLPFVASEHSPIDYRIR